MSNNNSLEGGSERTQASNRDLDDEFEDFEAKINLMTQSKYGGFFGRLKLYASFAMKDFQRRWCLTSISVFTIVLCFTVAVLSQSLLDKTPMIFYTMAAQGFEADFQILAFTNQKKSKEKGMTDGSILPDIPQHDIRAAEHVERN